MGLHDREWMRDTKNEQPQQKAAWKPRRARPVLFVHYLAGFWPGLIAGIAIGLTIGLLL
ncbi:TPA: hypothetical protein QDZ42_004014 [Stenotrophomonas maltophilia]|nr:hypothetical protein [Stenotrophomonas maltophilia]